MPEIISHLLNDKRLRRIIKFGMVGVSGLLVNSVVLWLTHDEWNISLFMASPIAIIAAIFSNFLLNDFWTWRENRDFRHYTFGHRLARYYLSASVGALINYVVLLLLTKIAGWNYLISNLTGIAGGMFSNFILSEWWVFRESGGTKDQLP